MTRLIATQRPYIGVMGALGGRARKVILHYCLFGLFMGVIGSVLGVLLGIGISKMIIIVFSPSKIYIHTISLHIFYCYAENRWSIYINCTI